VIFLKLGGSLITEKAKAESARLDVLSRLAEEIAEAMRASPDTRLLIGHGSGSFGHPAAALYGTHRGAAGREEWRGFAEVWAAAGRLNRLVVDALAEEGLPVIAFPPSASTVCKAGEILEMSVEPIKRALASQLLPIVAGDVAFDRDWGATIVSTEKVFAFLARHLAPHRVLLAGIEPGVYANFPAATRVLPSLRNSDLGRIALGGSEATDVTGGMAGKVREALALAASIADLEVRIFSGADPGALRLAILGDEPGTLIVP
jgi:isopentenyl phosphate kinase